MNIETPLETPHTTYLPDELLTEHQVAEYLGMSVKTIRNWRWSGRGPNHCRLSPKLVRYEFSQIRAWVESKRRTSTSDPGEEAAA